MSVAHHGPLARARRQRGWTRKPEFRAAVSDVDYAQIVEQYGPDPAEDQKRYSPAKCIGVERNVVIGDP